jgi:uncharacterized delta-60 repeat protein
VRIDKSKPKLLLVVLFAITVLLISLPFSSGTAHAPDWTLSPMNLWDSGISYSLQIDQLGEDPIYLPLVLKIPVIPSTPVLNPISNADGDGNYAISWTESVGTEAYLLQEDDNSNFTSPTIAFEGLAITHAISGKSTGTYYYRVMATNSYASSDWSNIESVVVSIIAPPCPQAGSWRGTTSQDESFEFIVENSPACQIAAGSLKISFYTSLCGGATTTFLSAFPITDNKFSVSSYTLDASGEFTASDLAIGTLTVDYYMSGRCYYTGSWEANPVVGANGPVFDLLVQANNMILVGGNFTEVGQQTHHNLARLNPDGSLDSAFTPDFNSSLNALAIQADGKILAAGPFSQVDGALHAGVARLNPDGSLDTDFTAQIDGDVDVLALQSDGKILVGGWFSAVNGQPRTSLARLNSNGTLDEAFNVNSAYMDVYALEVQSDDKILLGGYFEDVSGMDWADYFVRLNSNGTLDTSFQPDTRGWWVDEIAVQADGKILAAMYSDLARFTTNGTRDTSFNSPDPLGGSIRYMAIQTDGALVVGGDYINLGDDDFNYLARLNTDGTLNAAFNPGANAEIYALAVQTDNKILVGGTFTQMDGQVRHSITRLNSDGSLDLSFSLLP